MKQQTIYGMLVAMLLLLAIGLVSVGSVADRVIAQDGEPTPTPELEDALERAQTFSGDSNNDWEPFVWEFDGVEMVLVPAGCFEMGATDVDFASPVVNYKTVDIDVFPKGRQGGWLRAVGFHTDVVSDLVLVILHLLGDTVVVFEREFKARGTSVVGH